MDSPKSFSPIQKKISPGEDVTFIRPLSERVKDMEVSPIQEESPVEIIDQDSDWRNVFWNYPKSLYKLYYFTKPLSFIFLYICIAILLFRLLTSASILRYFSSADDGTFTEAAIGVPESLNPLFVTQNPVDRDLQRLIFQKLIDIDSDGSPVAEIAENWTVSEDRKVYDFRLKDSLFWHDGEKLTALDVKFTVDTAIKLAKEFNKDTVGLSLLTVETKIVDDLDVQFVLPESDPAFFEKVAVYVVPEHILKDLNLQNAQFSNFNTQAIGSGPYKIESFSTSEVLLSSYQRFLPVPKIKQFRYLLFNNVEDLKVALWNNEIDALSGLSEKDLGFLKDYALFNKYKVTLKRRIKLLFFNTRTNELANTSLRRGILRITDRDVLLKNSEVDGHPLKDMYDESSWVFNSSLDYLNYSPNDALKEFLDAGYVKNTQSGYFESQEKKILSLKLTYLDNDSNERVAKQLQKQWDSEGVILQLDPQDYEEITKETIPTRNFELLLYEIETSVDPDQFNLWHSSKVDYPNLNLSGYKLNRVDTLLEHARVTVDQNKRKADYDLIQKYIVNDTPVIFLYEPVYTYALSKKISGFDPSSLNYPSDRFRTIASWETSR